MKDTQLEQLLYVEDYVIMAYRILNESIDKQKEKKLKKIICHLMDIYPGVEIHDYVFYNKIL